VLITSADKRIRIILFKKIGSLQGNLPTTFSKHHPTNLQQSTKVRTFTRIRTMAEHQHNLMSLYHPLINLITDLEILLWHKVTILKGGNISKLSSILCRLWPLLGQSLAISNLQGRVKILSPPGKPLVRKRNRNVQTTLDRTDLWYQALLKPLIGLTFKLWKQQRQTKKTSVC
jgi:hypothetical protein